MRLNIRPPKNAFDVVCKKWGLADAKPILQNYRSSVYKVASPQGPAKLKLYTQIGYRGERAAISFSKQVKANAIAQIYQSDFYRAAVLSEWVEGPTLGETFQPGDYEKATQQACEAIKKLSENNRAPIPFIYRRKTAVTYRDLRQKLRQSRDPKDRALLCDALEILETLLSRKADERLLHGDLHYDNMILTPDGARAIDPRGVQAHPVVNCQSLFVGHKAGFDRSEFAEALNNQVKIITEMLGYDRSLVLNFARFVWILGLIKQKNGTQAGRDQRLDEIETIKMLADA